MLEFPFDTLVSTCSESFYQIARGDQITIAVDLIVREEGCLGDPCAPFGLIDPIENVLNDIDIATEEDPQLASMKANVEVTEVTVGDAVFYIGNSVQEEAGLWLKITIMDPIRVLFLLHRPRFRV
ncbi:hypothetical protein ACXYN8_11640 [Altererythrobacter sp. CAU 1778]